MENTVDEMGEAPKSTENIKNDVRTFTQFTSAGSFIVGFNA